MDASSDSEPTATKHPTAVERRSEREMVITRTFDAPARLVFEAWTKADLFQRWWLPASAGLKLLSCQMDVRVGGGYRLEFDHRDVVGSRRQVDVFEHGVDQRRQFR